MYICSSGKNGFERSDISRLREVCQQLSDKKPSVEYVCCLIAEANEVHMQEDDACMAFRALSDLNRLVLGLRYSEFLVPCGIYSENTTISMRGYLREEFLGMLGFSFTTLMEVLKTVGLE